MSLQPDLDIRNGPGRGIQLIVAGLVLGLPGVLLLPVGGLIYLLPGVGLLLYGAIRLVDRTVKVSLTAEGLKDHRSGVLIRWRDIRGVRVYAVGERSYGGVLYVRVSHGNGEREVTVNIGGLDRDPGEIAQLVGKRAKAVLQQQAPHQIGPGYTIEVNPHDAGKKRDIQGDSA